MTEQATKRYVMVFGVISILSFLTVFLSDYTGCANAATCGIGDTRVIGSGLTVNDDGGGSASDDLRYESDNFEYLLSGKAADDTFAIGQESADAGELFTVNGTSNFKGASSFTTITATGGTITGITDLALADGGTGASTASAARTNLGVAIGSDVQAWDADLDTVSGLTKTDGNIIVADGLNWTVESGATARTSLGLGSLATQSNIDNGDWSGTDLSVANGGTGASSLTDHYVLVGSGTGAITPVTPSTSGYVLTSNGTGADPTFQAIPSGGADVQTKNSDEVVNNSSTLQNDDDLSFSVSANTVYAFDAFLVFESHGSADIKFDISLPSGDYRLRYSQGGSGGGWAGDFSVTSQWDYATGTGTIRVIHIVGTLNIGGSAGTVNLQWAQKAAHASDTTIYAGSWMRLDG